MRRCLLSRVIFSRRSSAALPKCPVDSRTNGITLAHSVPDYVVIFAASLLAAAAPLVVAAAMFADIACSEVGSTIDTSTGYKIALSSTAMSGYRDAEASRGSNVTRDVVGEALRKSLLSNRQTAVCLKVRSLEFNRQFDEWNGWSNRSHEFG